MYAETFNVQSVFEEPAKWLRWAFQSLSAGNLTDCSYNLNQFWNVLSGAKSAARTALEWGDIMTMDAQSHVCLGWYYQALQRDAQSKLNLNQVLPAGALLDIGADSYRTQINTFGQKAEESQATAQDLANQAKSYYSQASAAGQDTSAKQAVNTTTVATNNKASTAQDNKRANDFANNATTIWKELADLLKKPLFGMPTWVWIAGGVLVFALIESAPSAAVAALRRESE